MFGLKDIYFFLKFMLVFIVLWYSILFYFLLFYLKSISYWSMYFKSMCESSHVCFIWHCLRMPVSVRSNRNKLWNHNKWMSFVAMLKSRNMFSTRHWSIWMLMFAIVYRQTMWSQNKYLYQYFVFKWSYMRR